MVFLLLMTKGELSLDMTTIPDHSLVAFLAQGPDFRRDDERTTHRLVDILTIAVCAVLCGANSWTDMETFGHAKENWFRQFLALPEGLPSHDTYRRVFMLLAPEAWQPLFQEWAVAMQERCRSATGLAPAINIDGKHLRGTRPRQGSLTAGLRLVSAWSEECRLVLGQVKTAEKSNEITAIPQLLKMLDISGCVVTIDAMGCQTAIVQQIKTQGGDYVLSLKGNQETLHEEVRSYWEWAARRAYQDIVYDYAETLDKGHGRLEVRRCWVTQDVAWLTNLAKWSGLRSIACVESEREMLGTGQISVERRYFISSLGVPAQELLGYIRGHWAIENGLHWVLDVAFREDGKQSRAGHSAENLALVRHFAVNLLKQEKSSRVGIEAKRKQAGWDENYLLKVLKILDA